MNARVTALAASAAAAAAAAWLASRRSAATAEATASAVARGGEVKLRLTGYWPYEAARSGSAAERRMEGGLNDRKGRPLHTLEQHLADPARHPYVSAAGDDAAWPYGQRVSIDQWPGAVFRVVDTGGNFRGSAKVYRVLGREPLDICVDSKATKVPKEATAIIHKGDHLDRPGREVAASRFKGQSVSISGGRPALPSGFDLFGADPIERVLAETQQALRRRG